MKAVYATLFAALSDPTRVAIVQRLAEGEFSVSDLAQPFALSQPTITSHLNVLERAGLIHRRRVAQRRLCRLRPEAIASLAEWLDAIGRQWSARADRMADHAASMTEKGD